MLYDIVLISYTLDLAGSVDNYVFVYDIVIDKLFFYKIAYITVCLALEIVSIYAN